MDSLSEQFSRVYDQYIEKIYRFVYLKVNSQEIAEDITSKVFTKAWKTYSQPNSKITNLGAFLYKIAGNSVIDFYRQKDRTKTVSTDSIAEPVSQEANAHDKAILSAEIERIKTHISKLNKEHQDIILWHYLEDLSIEEIAEITGKPAGTIRVALHRGLKALKEIIEAE